MCFRWVKCKVSVLKAWLCLVWLLPQAQIQPLLSLTLSIYLFSQVIFYKWNSSCSKDETNWCWALCWLHCWKYPQACVGLELGRSMDALFVLTFIPVSPCPWDAQSLCTPTKQSHKYLHTQGFSQRLLHCLNLALGYPLCSTGTSRGRTEIQDLVTVWALGVSAVQRKVTL